MDTIRNPQKRELLAEDINNIIDLLNTLRSEIRRCEDQYYASRDWKQEFNLEYWYNRLFIPTNICADIVTLSNALLRWVFNPWEWYERNFSGTEHIFTIIPSSNEVFLQTIRYLRSLLIPLVLLYLHAVKNPENQDWSKQLVWDITKMVAWIIKVRWEDKEAKAWEAIDMWGKYFSQ